MAVWVRYSHGGGALLSLLSAALLAVWWLWRPELMLVLPFSLRLPIVALGVWALGAAFIRPVAQDMELYRLLVLINTPWTHAALWGFAIVTLGLAVYRGLG
ncbi:hypothetical protein HHA01_10320 [Halomonas halmophila]|uniref:Uncharacterized protein n=1 Tax=Halomonas halmophila TaxID=252 RepID=A0A4Y4F097_9GAMM|nr:hypothetical protein HHA01_10320 [Halomonas halmophila]